MLLIDLASLDLITFIELMSVVEEILFNNLILTGVRFGC